MEIGSSLSIGYLKCKPIQIKAMRMLKVMDTAMVMVMMVTVEVLDMHMMKDKDTIMIMAMVEVDMAVITALVATVMGYKQLVTLAKTKKIWITYS